MGRKEGAADLTNLPDWSELLVEGGETKQMGSSAPQRGSAGKERNEGREGRRGEGGEENFVTGRIYFQEEDRGRGGFMGQ